MIQEQIILNLLRDEHNYWDQTGMTEFIRGVCRGLKIAATIVQQTGVRARLERDLYKTQIEPWTADRFRKALRGALAQLNRCDRKRAVIVLEKALKHPSKETL